MINAVSGAPIIQTEVDPIMKVSLKQLSERTGLSISTVSRVMTGKGYVSAEARAAIEKAAAELGYVRPHQEASMLNDPGSTVLIIVGGIKSSLAASTVEILVDNLEKRQKRPFVMITGFSPERERACLQFAIDNHIFGVIGMTIMETPETIEMLRNFPCPITMIDRYLPSLDLDYLRPDYYKMGYDAAEYLIAHGHTRIAFIGGSKSSPITQDKKIGFEDCMNAHRLPIHPEWIMHVERLIYENGKLIADRILNMAERPTAIVTSNDISVSILNELLVRGLRVPEDMSIFVCEDSSMAEYCQIPLTAMMVDEKRIAADAVKTLCRRHNQPHAPHCFLNYTPRLIERASVAPPKKP